MTIVAIDPGTNGGVARLSNSGSWTLTKMPEEKAWPEIVDGWRAEDLLVVIEKQQLRRGDVEDFKLWNLQKLVASVDRLKGRLEQAAIPYVEILPVSWQAPFKLIGKEEKSLRKKRYQSLAGELVGKKVPLWGSDAVLLGYFARKKSTEDPGWLKSRIVSSRELSIFNHTNK